MKHAIIIGILILLLIAGCKKVDQQAEANNAALKLSTSLSAGEYAAAYALFTTELSAKRSAADFEAYLKALPSNVTMTFDKAELSADQKTATAYYNLSDGSATNAKMVLVKDAWKIDGFNDYFEDACIVDCADDSDECTNETCDATTGFICEHKKIEGCAHEGDVCTVKEECGTMDCIEGACLKVECYNNEECTDGKVCIDYLCLLNIACTKNTDCPEEQPYCRSGLCKKDQCKTAADCPKSMPYCRQSKCFMTECSESTDCAAKEAACKTQCEAADGIMEDVICSPTKGKCRCNCGFA